MRGTPAPPETDTAYPTIPVPVPITYDELRDAAVQGKSVDAELPCPQCLAVGVLVYTGRWVERGVVMLGPEGQVAPQVWRVPIARCGGCRARLRVLPRELLPFKSFCLPVIEGACARYVEADPHGPGLRRTVRRMGKYAPAHATLWRWLAGLGERTLDRGAVRTVRAYASLPPAAALVAESAQHRSQGLRRVWERRFPIPAWKHLSEKRREQLEGCARVLASARRLFPEDTAPLSAWHGWLIARFHVAAWAFPTGMPCTELELTPSSAGALRSVAKSKPSEGGRDDEARSPP
jgi:hypothetical protein